MPILPGRRLRKQTFTRIACRLFALTVVLILHNTAAWGQLPDLTAGDPTVPWHIMADRIYYDEPNQSYVAEGDVSITREGRVLTADRVVLDDRSRQATAEGDVRLVSGQDQIYGQRLELDLDRETGVLSDGTLFLAQNHLYISGSEIEKTGPESYAIRDATLTSCDDPNPAWRITGRRIEVTIEGYGTARHAAFWVRRIPVVYTPFLLFPVKLERQSGLLAPAFGYSERNGPEYLQPLYWAIGESSDATIFAHYLDRRGLRGGLEYRYILDPGSFGTLMADGLRDRQVDGAGENSSIWGYSDDSFPRPNKDRYWLRAKADQDLPADFKARLDLDIVSDQDYLREFRSGQNGFSYSRDYFRDTFNRDIDDYDEPVRLNRLNTSRIWTNYTLNADISWLDDIVKRRQGETDDTLQQLPAVAFDGIRQTVGQSPFYVGFSSSYVNFYSEDGQRGQRADFHPRVYYPFYLLRGISAEPSAGFRQTAWHIDRETDPAEDQRDYYRAIYDLRLDLNTEFFRVFRFEAAGYDRLRHAIAPEITYEYIPDTEADQEEDLPLFTRAVDRIERQNTITYGVTNYLTARRPLPASEDRITLFDYLDFFRFKLSQSFDINEHKEHDEEKEREEDAEKPFSDIIAEMDITPGRFLNLTSRAEWSPYDNRLNRLRAGPSLWDDRGDFLYASYVYRRENARTETLEGIEGLSLTARLVIDAHWLLRGGYEYDFVRNDLITSSIGFGYKSQCWGIDFDYREEPGDRGFVVFFTLVGIGVIGQ